MQALLNSGDEMLGPGAGLSAVTAAVALSSGKAVHYLCDESSDWFPTSTISARKSPRVPAAS